jgi:DNA-binding NarL/FixJ family response regulator
MDKIRVAIIDDDGLIRDGLEAILSTHSDMECALSAADGREGAALCEKLRPEVVLMDIRMPGTDGVVATGLIKQKMPWIKIIILTTFDDNNYIRSAMDAGAEGYILKSSPAEAIIESIRAVHRGTSVLQTEIARRLSSSLSSGKENTLSQSGLSPRELEILTLIAEGLSNKEIAGRLNLSDGTVRNYISDMLLKLKVRDRTQLAIFYYRSLS